MGGRVEEMYDKLCIAGVQFMYSLATLVRPLLATTSLQPPCATCSSANWHGPPNHV